MVLLGDARREAVAKLLHETLGLSPVELLALEGLVTFLVVRAFDLSVGKRSEVLIRRGIPRLRGRCDVIF